MGMSGVQRTLKFAKYLPSFGWEPEILTVSKPSYFAFDASLADDLPDSTRVHRTASWDALSLIGLFRMGRPPTLNGQDIDPPERLREPLSLCSQTFFQPDNKIGWLPFAAREGMRLLDNGSFDLVYTTAPPYTGHLVGLALKRLCKRPLVVDFRDAWTLNPLHTYATPFHLRMSRLLERVVLEQADAVVSINQWIRDGLLRSVFCRHPRKFSVISHGFDPEDFEFNEGKSAPPADVFTITYTGTFYGARTPKYFLRALRMFLDEMPGARDHVKAVFVGLFRKDNQWLVQDLHLGDVVQIVPYAEHRESVGYLLRSHLLWITIAEGPTVSTSKLYEYLGAHKPILACVPPDGAAARLVRALGNGTIVAPDDVQGIKEALRAYYHQYTTTGLPVGDAQAAGKYDRKALTGQLASVFDSVLTQGT